MPMYASLGLSVAIALVVSIAATPAVKLFANRIGAIDVPKDSRRVHKSPIPRLGGLAIFLGFVISTIFFVDITRQILGILIGSVIIVIIGVIDDIRPLRAYIKLIVQIAAALVAVYFGIVIDIFSNPLVFSANEFVHLGYFSIPVTIIWIVAITNSVNLIDGLDGLAVGVSTISSIVMLVIALMVSDLNIALILAALTGACLGFMPYNFNPAKIFMGDTGALLLGYVLATVSILGLFKFYAVVSFAVPFLVLAIPLFDTSFAFLRRLLRGQNPMSPDRGHFHHRLLDMGLTQKQAVAVLYAISGLLGLAAVVITTSDKIRALILVVAVVIAVAIVFFVIRGKRASPRRKAAKTQLTEGERSGEPLDGPQAAEEAEDPEKSKKIPGSGEQGAGSGSNEAAPDPDEDDAR